MNYTLHSPCSECPFLKSMKGFTTKRLKEFATGEFPCHRTAEVSEEDDMAGEYHAKPDSLHCAGALIWNEKRGTPHQMMRICERLGYYDHTKLNMEADVR